MNDLEGSVQPQLQKMRKQLEKWKVGIDIQLAELSTSRRDHDLEEVKTDKSFE
jgi:hypothetical protein